MSAKPLPEDVMVVRFRDRCAIVADSGDAGAALDLVRQVNDLAGKVELRLVIDRSGAPPPERQGDGRAVILASKYPGSCKACGKPYKAGESVRWIRAVGCFCLGCKPKP